MTDHKVDVHIARLQPGTLVDVVIKGVEFAYEHTTDHGAGSFSIRADDGRRFIMPPQAAITQPGQTDSDAATLRERLNSALNSIDHMTDEQTLDPWTALALRKNLDPNPRHWPPQAGDVWDDGMPFGGSLWFARKLQAEGPGWSETAIVMTSVAVDMRTYSPDELLAAGGELTLAYRPKDSQR